MRMSKEQSQLKHFTAYRFRHMLTISLSIFLTPGNTSGCKGLVTTNLAMASLMTALSSSPPFNIPSQPTLGKCLHWCLHDRQLHWLSRYPHPPSQASSSFPIHSLAILFLSRLPAKSSLSLIWRHRDTDLAQAFLWAQLGFWLVQNWVWLCWKGRRAWCGRLEIWYWFWSHWQCHITLLPWRGESRREEHISRPSKWIQLWQSGQSEVDNFRCCLWALKTQALWMLKFSMTSYLFTHLCIPDGPIRPWQSRWWRPIPLEVDTVVT